MNATGGLEGCDFEFRGRTGHDDLMPTVPQSATAGVLAAQVREEELAACQHELHVLRAALETARHPTAAEAKCAQHEMAGFR